MISDKTRATLEHIRDTLQAGIVAGDAIADTLHAAGLDVAAYPADAINAIGAALINRLPDLYEQAAAVLGLDEHITVEVPEKGATVTGEIIR